MIKKKFIRGEKYSHEDYIQLSISEMNKSKSEHVDKKDPKVGAVLVTPDGKYFDKSHRGELRIGDHAEFTVLERKNIGVDLTGYILYTTLEPCVKRNPPKKGCAYRSINARLGKIIIGHQDPDPTVAGKGIKLIKKEKIEVEYYDRKYEKLIAEANREFFRQAEQRAYKEKENNLIYESNSIDEPLKNHNFNDLSEEALNELINRIDLPYKLDSKAFISYLNKMGLIVYDDIADTLNPSGLGLLLLGKNPSTEFPQARIKFTIRRENLDPIIKDFDGPLILLPEKIGEYLEFIFPKGFTRSSFQRSENVESSYSAILEVIMNAIVHRDYSIQGARVLIEIEDDKILVSSPGKPISPMEKLNSFTAPSFSRNPKIAYIFHEMKYVEERGFGMEELSRLEKDYGLPKPTFELDGNILKTTIYRIPNKDINKPTAKSLRALPYLLQHESLTSKAYSEITGVSPRTAQRHLNELVSIGKAKKEGKGPSTIYSKK